MPIPLEESSTDPLFTAFAWQNQRKAGRGGNVSFRSQLDSVKACCSAPDVFLLCDEMAPAEEQGQHDRTRFIVVEDARNGTLTCPVEGCKTALRMETSKELADNPVVGNREELCF